MRDHIIVGDDDCWMEISRHAETYHIEIGCPVTSYNADMTADDLRDLAEAIGEMIA